MESAHKFTDMVKEFQISSLIELLDSFGESTLYKLPTATKAWCKRRDNDCRTTDSEQYNFFQNSNLRWCNKSGSNNSVRSSFVKILFTNDCNVQNYFVRISIQFCCDYV